MNILSRLFGRADNGKQYCLSDFYGTYLGFSPTDASPTAMGELEITLNADAMKVRMATGIKIDVHEAPTTLFVPMTAAEVAAEYVLGSREPRKMVGFKVPRGSPRYLFHKNPGKLDFGLIVRGLGMAELLGPTLLFSPSQVANGLYQKALDAVIEQAGPDTVPLLKYDGKLGPNYRSR